MSKTRSFYSRTPPRPHTEFVPVHGRFFTSRKWKLTKEYEYKWYVDDELVRLRVPEGFEYDQASVPWILWSVRLDPLAFDAAALLHDWIYRWQGDLPERSLQKLVEKERRRPNTAIVERTETIRQWREIGKKWTRYDADRLMFRVAREFGVPKWKRRVGYWAVRAFGWRAWSKARKTYTLD